MADWWEPLYVVPPSVLRIPYMLREEGGGVNEDCHTFHNGNSSNNLVSDRCERNATTDNSEAASAPTVISVTPSQSNPTKESQYKPIQAQSGGIPGGPQRPLS